MISVRLCLAFLSVLVIGVLAGGVLAGCGSSSSTATGGGTIETAGVSGQEEDPGSGEQTPERDSTQRSGSTLSGREGEAADEDSELESGVYATGRVVYPDTTAVPKAYISTEPYAGAVLADSSGRFRLREPLPENEYTFIAQKGEREGRTVVSAPGERVKKRIWIMVGTGERALDAISIDSIRANPGGPGLKRTGN